jgi:hypothetical protein
MFLLISASYTFIDVDVDDVAVVVFVVAIVFNVVDTGLLSKNQHMKITTFKMCTLCL